MTQTNETTECHDSDDGLHCSCWDELGYKCCYCSSISAIDVYAEDDIDNRILVMGDRVKKEGGDYTFEGEVVSVFRKHNLKIRVVVEDDRGLLFIFNLDQLDRIT